VAWFQHCWNPNRPYLEVLREYAGYYFYSKHTQQVVESIKRLEKSHKQPLEEQMSVKKAWQLAQKLDTQLPTWSQNSWRWRLSRG
jgi:hypothetical protein